MRHRPAPASNPSTSGAGANTPTSQPTYVQGANQSANTPSNNTPPYAPNPPRYPSPQPVNQYPSPQPMRPPNQPPYPQQPVQQPYGQPQPMQQPPNVGQQYPTQPKRRSPVLWIVLGIIGTLILGCVGLVALGLILVGGYTGDSEKTMTTFLNAAKREDVSSAYAVSTSPITRDELQTFFSSNEYLKDFQSVKVSSADYTSRSSGDTLDIKGTVNYGSSGTGTFTGQLTKVGGTWKVNEFTPQSPT